ncbi:Uncharacterised protein [uncultured Blautia sp.]|nr:Uncharacterised protein [uncultured Blautia sp.]
MLSGILHRAVESIARREGAEVCGAEFLLPAMLHNRADRQRAESSIVNHACIKKAHEQSLTGHLLYLIHRDAALHADRGGRHFIRQDHILIVDHFRDTCQGILIEIPRNEPQARQILLIEDDLVLFRKVNQPFCQPRVRRRENLVKLPLKFILIHRSLHHVSQSKDFEAECILHVLLREGLRLRKLLLEVGEVLLTQRTEVTIQIVVCHKKSSRDHVLSNPSIRL